MMTGSARIADGAWHASDRRQINRSRIDRTAVLRLADKAYSVHLEDLARDGCKITTNLDLELGSECVLGFAGVGQTTARVIWQDGRTFGFVFDDQLPTGAVTAATLNNVDNLEVNRVVRPEDVKWSRGRQLTFIVGSSLALWTVIIAGFAFVL